MSPFMLKVTEVHRGKSVAFIEELLTGTVNFVELSTSYQPPNKPFEGEGVGVRAMDTFAELKPSQVLLFSLHQLKVLKVPLETTT